MAVVATTLLVLIVLCVRGLPIEGNLFALLPQDQDSAVINKAIDHYNDNVTPEAVMIVSGDSLEQAEAAAAAYRQSLMKTPWFEQIQLTWSIDQQVSNYEFWYPYRGLLLTPEQRESLRDGRFKEMAQSAVAKTYSGFTGVGGRELEGDPFLLFRDFIQSSYQGGGRIRWNDGYLTAHYDNKYWVLMRAHMAAAPSLLNSTQALDDIDAAVAEVAGRYPANQLSMSGLFFYTATGMAAGQHDISRIGVGSLLGIILLMLVAFRSLMPIACGLVAIAVGFVMALTVTVLVFGQIHIFALVFGTGIIGVSIDYAFHYFADRQCGDEHWQPQRAMRGIYPAISLALLTSALAYFSLVLTPLPGIKQMAIFAVVGLVSAWVTVVCCFPYWVTQPSSSGVPFKRLLLGWLRWCGFVAQLRHWLWLMPALAVVVITVFPGWHVNDDVRALQSPSLELRQQEKVIAAATGSRISTMFFLVAGESTEEMLQRNELAVAALLKLKQQGKLQGFRALPVPSQMSQQENYQLQQQLYAAESTSVMDQLGLESLRVSRSNAPVLLQSWLAHPNSESWRQLWLSDEELARGETVYSVIQLYGVDNKTWLEYVDSDIDGVTLIDRAGSLSDMLHRVRTLVTGLLCVAYAIVMVVLAGRYGLSRLPQLMLAPVASSTIALACLVILGVEVNAFTILALILVLGIGIDYTLFFAETKKLELSTLVATTLAAITTLLSFGLLALSSTAAISHFGLTVALGIVVAWLFSPMAAKQISPAVVNRSQSQQGQDA
ncbi:putative exporter [Sinobacterium caligoides]|uniref:Putative exporter n=1 Tax=Sinobacterium caligoides TaxID=933926 RepID=A0A3N2DP46_9GAMM|nr:putative exporter [Sinobacterium caligoides]